MNKQIAAPAMEITAIIITHGRSELLQRMLHSLDLARRFAEKQQSLLFELKILLNGDDAESEKVLSEQFEFEKVDKPVTPAAARNLLLEKVESNWVVFIDDDIQLPEDFFINFKKISAEHPEIDVWGGPNTTPVHSSGPQIRNGWMLSNHCITGPVANRYAIKGKKFSNGNQFNLTLCNLFIKTNCLKKSVFLPFLKTAEENELIYYLKENGCKLAASDLLCVSHERRSNTQRFLKQIFYYGYGRGQLFFNVAISKQLIFVFVPAVACVILIGSFFSPWALLFWISIINLSYLFTFKKLDPVVVLLPPTIWAVYIMGLASGTYASFQQLLQKRKSSRPQEISRRTSV